MRAENSRCSDALSLYGNGLATESKRYCAKIESISMLTRPFCDMVDVQVMVDGFQTRVHLSIIKLKIQLGSIDT